MSIKIKSAFHHWIFCWISLFIFCAADGRAQDTAIDSSLYVQSIQNLQTVYKSRIKEQLRLYDGSRYHRFFMPGQKEIGFPYFATDSSLVGSIYYNGAFYDSVSMRFDLIYEKVIINDYLSNTPIELYSDKISFFTIENHRFFKIPPLVSVKINSIEPFYELLYGGKDSLWVTRKKKFELSFRPEDQTGTYKEYDYYFLQIHGVYYSVDTKSAFLDAIKNKKQNVQSFIKKNNLNFKKDFETALIRAVQYYDELNEL
jgi:hypothetical protein